MCGNAVTGNRKEILLDTRFKYRNRISCSLSGISAASLSVAQILADRTLNYNVIAVITQARTKKRFHSAITSRF